MDTIDYRATRSAAISISEVARLSATLQDANPADRLRSMVVLPDGGLAFVEPAARRVVFLGPHAEPLGSFGREGGAPGEFRNVFGIGLTGDTLWVGDSRQDRATLLTSDRKLLREFNLPKVTGQGSEIPEVAMKVLLGLQTGGFIGLLPSDDQLFRADLTGDFLNPLPASRSDARPVKLGDATVFASLFPPRPKLDVSADGTLVAAYEHVMEGGLAPATSVAIVRSTGDTAYVRVIRFEGIMMDRSRVDSLVSQRTRNFPAEHVRTFRSEVYVPPFHPPVEDVVIGQDNRVWLKLHTVGDHQDYLVLGADGGLVGTVVLPARTTVRAARGNVVWTLQYNEFDVADIVKYEVVGF